MEEKFRAEIKKKLDAFRSAKEWSDFISLLSSLDRTLKTYNIDKVVELRVLTKRLTQCLSPALPAGVHTKCLETYQIVFNKFSKQNFIKYFDLATFGFFSSASNLKTMALTNYFNIIEEKIIPIAKEIEKYIDNLIIGLLPFLEIDDSEYFNQSLILLDKLKEMIDPKVFYDSIWNSFKTNSPLRLSVVNYLFKTQETKFIAKTEDSFALAICSALQDKQIAVLRGSLDILINYFPLNEIKSHDDINMIVLSVIKLFLLRDLSINKRILTWINLKEQNNFESVNSALKMLLSQDLTLFYRVMMTLTDFEELFEHLVDHLVLKSLFYLKKPSKKQETIDFFFQKEEKNEPMKYAEIFFENLDRNLFWKSVERNLIFILEENTANEKLKGGKEKKENSSFEEEFINESKIEKEEEKIEQIKEEEEEKLKELKIKEGIKIEKEETFEKNEQTLILEPKNEEEIKVEEIIEAINEDFQVKNKILTNELKDELINEKEIKEDDKLINEQLINEEDKLIDEKEINKSDKSSEDDEEEYHMINEKEVHEEKEESIENDTDEKIKHTFITRSSDEFIELLIYLHDKFNLINEEINANFIPKLLLIISENYFKFEENNLLLFFNAYKINIDSLELCISLQKTINLEDFILFCSLLELYMKYFNFLNHSDDKFWTNFYQKFIKITPLEKIKSVFLFYALKDEKKVFDSFEVEDLFDNLISDVNEYTVKCLFLFNPIFQNKLEGLFLGYISDLDLLIIENINKTFYYLFNYLEINEKSFFNALICYCHKFETIKSFNSEFYDDLINSDFKKETNEIEIRTKIIELFNLIYNNKLILSLIIDALKSNLEGNKILNNKMILGALSVLNCFVSFSSSFNTFLSKEKDINSDTLVLLEILFILPRNHDTLLFDNKEVQQTNYDISIKSLDIINLLLEKEAISKKEIINFDLSLLFEFVVKKNNPLLFDKITKLLEISVNGFKKIDFTAFDVLINCTNNINYLFNVIFKMENKIAQLRIFNKMIEFKERKEIFNIYKAVKYITENNQYYNKEDLEILINNLIRNINIYIITNNNISNINTNTNINTNISTTVVVKEETKFSFFYYYVNKIILNLLSKFSKAVIDSILNNNFMIHNLFCKNKLYDLILRRILNEKKALIYLSELNKYLNKEELKVIILENKELIGDIYLVNKKLLEMDHYKFIIDLFLKGKREKEELISKIFNNLLLNIQRMVNYKNKEITEMMDKIIKSNKRINFNDNLLINIVFSLVILKEKEIREISLECLYEISNKVQFKFINDYFLSNEFFLGSSDTKYKILKKYTKYETTKFGELLAKIDQGFFLTRESEILNKHHALKRAAFYMLTGEINQFMMYFPKILEKLIELVNMDSLLRKTFFLLLRVLIVKNNHSKLSNLWPSLFNEIFKLLEIESSEIFKFLDLLFIINSGETLEFQKAFFISSYYKKVYYEGKGLKEYSSEENSKKCIFNNLLEKADPLIKKDILIIPNKRKPFFSNKKVVKTSDIAEYLTYAPYYYTHLNEFTNEIDNESILESLLVEFNEE